MCDKKISIGLTATLAIVAVVLLVTGTAASQEKVLHSFGHGTDGTLPLAGLIMDAAGNFYGTTFAGGIHNFGTVFELTPNGSGGWSEQVLHSFGNGTDGSIPYASLTFDAASNLYGTTGAGGAHAKGTVFELTPREGGGWTEEVLHSFGNGSDGAGPSAGLIFDTAGNLYGTTQEGGIHSCNGSTCGTVFELTPNESGGWTEKVLHSFGNDTDGVQPFAGLILDGSGNLYGTTFYGGIHAVGTVFELTPNGSGSWTEKVLHSFGNGTDAAYPRASLMIDAAGSLYGTTQGGGINDEGAVFELTPEVGGGWTEKVLHSLGDPGDGAASFASLLFDTAGNLYGTTYAGGIHSYGTVFELTPDGSGGWTERVLHSFGNGTDGAQPRASLLFDGAGNLYSTTYAGGIHDYTGTVFEITP